MPEFSEGAPQPQHSEQPHGQEHQAGQPEQVKAVIIPPTHAEIVKTPIDSVNDPRVSGKFTEFKQTPSVLDTLTRQPGQEKPDDIEGLSDWTKRPRIENRLSQDEQRALQTIPSQEQWKRMSADDIKTAIEDGKITDPRALLVIAQRELEGARAMLVNEKDRAEVEARLKPLIKGDRKALAAYCFDQARPHLDYVHNRAEVDIAYHNAHPDQTDFNVSYSMQAGIENYQQAARWQDLSAQITAEKEGAIQPQPEDEAKRLMEESRITSEQHRTLDYLRDHPTQLAAIGTLQHTTPDALQTLMDTLEQTKVRDALQAEDKQATNTGKKGTDIIELLLMLIGGIKDSVVQTAQQVTQPENNQQKTS